MHALGRPERTERTRTVGGIDHTRPFALVTRTHSFDLASNNTYVTASIHSSAGDAVDIAGLQGTGRTAISFPVYNCNATNNACTHSRRGRIDWGQG